MHSRYLVPFGGLILVSALQAAPLPENPEVTRQALEIVAKQRGMFRAPPVVMPTRKVPDGPLLGNGDIGVAVGGVIERLRYFGLGEAGGASVTARRTTAEQCPETHRFYLSKNDFWKTKTVYPNAHPAPIGAIDVSIPALNGGTYSAEQRLATAEVIHTLTTGHRVEDPPPFTRAGTVINFHSWVAATENVVVIEISVAGDPNDANPFAPTALTGVDVKLWPLTGNESESASGNLPDGSWAVRRFVSTVESLALEQKPSARTTEAAVAMRLLQHRQPGLPWSRGDGWSADRFVIQPGRTAYIAASIVTSEESPQPLAEAKRRIADLSVERLAALKDAHGAWWRSFWAKSFVSIGDPLIEQFYYGSHYLMASCSRNPAFPPSLYGNWITADGPAWQADYHLNYNHQGPWWGVFSSNHVELADPYDTPILEYMPTAKQNAREFLKVPGVYYDVGIGPRGLETAFMPDGHGIPGEGNRMFLGQKSNAAFAAVNMLQRIRHTWDPAYAAKVYPFLMEVADFWESYLKLEDGRYVITNDASGEVGDGGSDRNNCLSLGLLRNFFAGLTAVSMELDKDAARRIKWQDILSRLSSFPTVEVDGIRRLRGAEAGPAAARIGPGRNNTRLEFMGMVWPSTVVGLGSDPALLRVLQDDVRGWADSEWIGHFNGFSMTYPGAVRVGHDPADILRRLRQQLSEHSFPNLMIFTGGGGIENCSGVPAAINEMLLQSHDGLLRVFPVWPREQAASFGRLRCEGAFLVSSRLVDGTIPHVIIESERGRNVRLLNPWPGQAVQFSSPHKTGTIKPEGELILATVPGEVLTLIPIKP
jgi:hypothetical protein